MNSTDRSKIGLVWYRKDLRVRDQAVLSMALSTCDRAHAAGVGTDPRDRIFDPIRQADMYNPDKSYRKLWLRPLE